MKVDRLKIEKCASPINIACCVVGGLILLFAPSDDVGKPFLTVMKITLPIVAAMILAGFFARYLRHRENTRFDATQPDPTPPINLSELSLRDVARRAEERP